MKVLLYEMGKYFYQIVLWDGQCTYWHEESTGSFGYTDESFIGPTNSITNGRFTYIGDL